MGKIIFVTGTDTGVGKTLLTASLLHHLRRTGVHALALKPFCSGGTHDVDLLHSLQDGELSRREINPFYFAAPVAPLIAARRLRRIVRLDQVVDHIRRVQAKGECLLVEGSGGLLVPLGAGYTVADLIAALRCEVSVPGARMALPLPVRNERGEGRGEGHPTADTPAHLQATRPSSPQPSPPSAGGEGEGSGALNACCEVIVVARNRLGTINHTLLTMRCLEDIGARRPVVVLMAEASADKSARTNAATLRELLVGIEVGSVPYLGRGASTAEAVKGNFKKMKILLARILQSGIFALRSLERLD